MEIIKIQSISDVITNSSSEVYLIVNERTIETMYEILEGLLGENARELFKIRINALSSIVEYSTEDFFGFVSKEDSKIYQIISKMEVDEIFRRIGDDTLGEILDYERLVELANNYYLENRSDLQQDSYVDPYIEVIPLVKTERVEGIAKMLSSLPRKFDYEIRIN